MWSKIARFLLGASAIAEKTRLLVDTRVYRSVQHTFYGQQHVCQWLHKQN